MKNFLVILLILMPFCCYGQFFDDFSSAQRFESNGWAGVGDHFLLAGDGDDEGNSGDADTDKEQSTENAPHFGAIVFSEVMANPKGAAALPEAEYVELYNRTDSVLELGGCLFHYGDRSYTLPAYALAGGEAVILCAKSDEASFATSVPRLSLSSFPQLANSGKLLYLENADGELIHWVEYADTWYGSTTLKKGGYALEAIDVERLYPSATNWGASTATAGGTPGAPNSIARHGTTAETPYVVRHAMANDGTLTLAFSKSVHPDTLTARMGATHIGISVLATDYPRNRTFSITLPDNVVADYQSLSTDGLTDIDGVTLFEAGSLLFASAHTAEAGDVVINELLFAPATAGGSTFVELLATGSYPIDLATLSLAVLDADSAVSRRYPLTTLPTLLNAGSYALVAADPLAVIAYYGYGGTPRIVVPAAMPSLDTTRGNIALLGEEDQVLDVLYYDVQMHASWISDATGVSLERRSPDESTSQRGNWTSGTAATGYATPGYRNEASGTAITADDSRSELLGNSRFALAAPRLSLGEDPTCTDLTLFYRLDETDVRLHATLYTASGVPAVHLEKGKTLSGAEGELTWGSAWRTDRTKTTGIYLLLLEYATPSGKTDKVKMPVAVVP